MIYFYSVNTKIKLKNFSLVTNKFRHIFRERYGNDEQAKTKMLMLLDELKDTDNSKAGQLINHIKAMPSF